MRCPGLDKWEVRRYKVTEERPLYLKGHSIYISNTLTKTGAPSWWDNLLQLTPQKRLCHDCNVLKKSVREEVKWLTQELRGKKLKKRLEPGSKKQGCSPLYSFFCFRQTSFP